MCNNLKISVVIPVYNSEDTICECIASIQSQEFVDFEIIVVDDGSSDASGAICDECQAKDKRVTVVHQMNKGRTEARAVGVEKAKGEWICFVDSDDKMPVSGLADLYSKADDNTDIVLGNGHVLKKERRDSIPIDEFRHMAVRGDGTIGLPWGSLYRRSIVIPYVFDIPREIINGEDYIFWLRLVFITERPVHVVYKSVYDKGEAHTCNDFLWTSDYCQKLNTLRESSIPQDVIDDFRVDMLDDRIANLFAVILQQPRREWGRSRFYLDILHDMEQYGVRMPLKRRIYINLPARILRKCYSLLGNARNRNSQV